MHEATVCHEIMDIVSAAAKENNIHKVFEITVAVGQFSCVNQNRLNFYFDVAKSGTCMESAVINLEKDLSLKGVTQMYVKTFRGE